MMRPILISAGLMVTGEVLRRALRRYSGAGEPLAEMPGGLMAREVVGSGSELVVVLHGPGAAPGQLERWLPTPRGPMLSLRGLHPHKDGYQWLTSRLQQTSAAAFLAEAETVAQRIGESIRAVGSKYGATRTAVVGFSQGGHLAWLLAARGLVDGAVIACGALPDTFTPPRPERPIEIAALGGTEDKTVPWALVDATRARFEAAGYAVTATSVKGGHTPQAVGPNLGPALEDVLARMSVHAL